MLGLLLAVALVALWLLWLHRRLAVAPGWSRPVRLASLGFLAGGMLLHLLANLIYRAYDPEPLRPLVWLGLTWLAVAAYLSLGALLLAVGSLLLRALGRPSARARLLRSGTPVVVLAALAVTGYGLVAAARPGVTAYDVRSAALPPGWDGARIVFLSDLHVGPVRDVSWTREAVRLANAEEPDLVLLGGDLVDGRERYVGPYLEPLADLDAPLGTFAVSGNHEFETGDPEAYSDRLESLGVDVLHNEGLRLTRGGDTAHLAGVEDHTGEGQDAPDPDAALAGTAPDDFVLFLAHQPRQAVQGAGVDLQLSGHTHGGQIWPFSLAVLLQQPTVAGVERVGDVPVVTGRGIGTSGPPVRVGSAPEVVVVTLHATG